jgi:hypothetical protein
MNVAKKERTSNPPEWFSLWVAQDFVPFKNEMRKRISNLIKKNNLKE